MKTSSIAIVAVVALATSAFTFIASANWKVVEETYTIKFDTKGANGTIGGLKGTINFDKDNLAASKFDVTVDVKTLNTGNGMKNGHALNEDFFNAEKYPTIHFVTSKIEKGAAGYNAKGKLTIKDVTKDVTIPFTFDESGSDATLKGSFDVNREDYNLKRNGVGEVVKIDLMLPLKK